ncbi:MAG: PIN domain-containing protein [Candidatus Saccharimonadales bacterium]
MVIDTNIYSAFMNGAQEPRARILACDQIVVPLAVAAEIQKGFLGGSRLEENMNDWSKFMTATRAEIACPIVSTAGLFAQLAMFCRQKGRVLSDNDLWIAATALEIGEPLLTLDKDFSVLVGYSELEVIVL